MGSGGSIRRSGRVQGTVAPAERYVSSQVGEGDVTLGDTSVPELMQTDAFELMVHDPELPRTRGEPGVQGLAGQPQVMAALHVQSESVQRLRSNPQAFDGLVQGRAERVGAGRPSRTRRARHVMGAIAGHSAGDAGLAAIRQALARSASNAAGVRQLCVNNANSFQRRRLEGVRPMPHGKQCGRVPAASPSDNAR